MSLIKLITNLPKSKLAIFGFLYTLANSVQKGIGFLAFMFLAMVLSVSDYATFGKHYALFSIICAACYAGVVEVAISVLPEFTSTKKKYYLFRLSNTLFIALASLAVFLIFCIHIFVLDNWNFSDIGIISFSAILSTFFLLQSQLTRLNEEHTASVGFSFLPQVAGYLFGLIFVYIFKSSISFFLGASLGYALSSLLYLHPRYIFFGMSKRLTAIKKPIRRLPPYLAIAFLSWVLGYGIVYIIDFFFADEEIAIYVFLYTISSIIQLVGSSMNQVWSPRFYKDFISKDVKSIEQGYNKFTLIQGIILGVVGSVILLFLPSLGLISESFSIYSDKGFILVWLFIGYVVSIPWWHIQNYYFVSNKGYNLMLITIISGIVGLIVWVVLMKILGEIGIYLGFFINCFSRSILIYLFARKHWNIHFDISGQFIGIVLLVITTVLLNGI